MILMILAACQPQEYAYIFDRKEIQLQADYYEGFKKKRILIDPGHGCADPGTSHRTDSSVAVEADINLQTALVLQEHLNSTGYYDARLTHDGAKPCPSLGQRARLASTQKASVLISLHADHGSRFSSGSWLIWSKHGHGLSNAEDNQWLATALGAGLYHHDFPLHRKINSYDETQSQSDRYLSTNKLYGVHIDNGSKGLYLLRKSKVPSVLIETHFMSNPKSIAFFHQEETLNAFATAIEQGLLTYFAVQDGVLLQDESNKTLIQVYSAQSKEEATEVVNELTQAGVAAHIELYDGGNIVWYRVIVESDGSVERAIEEVSELGYTDAFSVK